MFDFPYGLSFCRFLLGVILVTSVNSQKKPPILMASSTRGWGEDRGGNEAA